MAAYLCLCLKNVGKAMTASSFVSNLEGMNDGGNFCKDLLKVRHLSEAVGLPTFCPHFLHQKLRDFRYL